MSPQGQKHEHDSDLKAVEQAGLDIKTGKMVIIDPAYTEELNDRFQHDMFRGLKDPTFRRLLDQTPSDRIAVIQGSKAVYLGGFGGDGYYPIVRTSSGLEILFDFDYRRIEDLNKIGGVWVDYKMIMLADGNDVTQIDFPPDPSKATIVDNGSHNVSTGRYNVSFQNTGEPKGIYVARGERGRVVRIDLLQ